MTTPLDEAIRAGCSKHVGNINRCYWPHCTVRASEPCRPAAIGQEVLRAFIENPHLGISYECLQTLRKHLGDQA